MKKIILFCIIMLGISTIVSAIAVINQGNYRWRNDDGSLVNATPRANENVNSQIGKEINIRLRIEIYNDGQQPSDIVVNIHLSYREKGLSSWTDITNDGSNAFQLSTTVYYDESNTINDLLSNTDGYPPGGGYTIESSTSKNFTFNYQESYEAEYCFKATSNALDNTTYQFILRKGSTEFDVNTFPELTITTSPSVPIADWAIYIGILLIAGFLAISFFKRRFA